MKKKFTFEDYRKALVRACDPVKERLLTQANQDRSIDAWQFRELVGLAFPESV